MNDYMPGPTYAHMNASRRTQLEFEVQNLYGPIANINEMRDAELYGMRDEMLERQRAVGEDMERDE